MPELKNPHQNADQAKWTPSTIQTVIERIHRQLNVGEIALLIHSSSQSKAAQR